MNELNPRNGGSLYTGAWRTAIRSGKKLVVIETWNEFLEATEIAPNREDGDDGWREWRTTQHYTAIFHRQ